MIITDSECVSAALGNRHARRMRLIVLLRVACLAIPYFFPHYLTNGKIFGNKFTEHCSDFLYNFCL